VEISGCRKNNSFGVGKRPAIDLPENVTPSPNCRKRRHSIFTPRSQRRPPRYRAQFYPNANCQNKAANSPYTGNYQQQIRGAYAWGAGPCAMGAEYYVSRGGPPYTCY